MSISRYEMLQADTHLRSKTRVSVAFLLRVTFALNLVFSGMSPPAVLAHTADDFLPLKFTGYVAPFGFDETETYTGVWGTTFGSDDFAYLGSVSSGVSVVNISDAANPKAVSVFGDDLGVSFSDIRTAGNVGYFSTNEAGTLLVDLSNPTAPSLISSVSSFEQGLDSVSNAWVHDDHLFQVSAGDSAIAVFDISEPAVPLLTHRIETNDSEGIFDLSIVDDRLYAAGLGGAVGEGAAYIYDIQDIGNTPPTLVTQIATGENTASVWPTSDPTKLIVSQREAGGSATVWDIADPTAAFAIDSANATDLGVNAYSAGEIFVLDDVAYTAWHQAGVQVIDFGLLKETDAVVRSGAFGTSQASPLEKFVGNTSVHPMEHDTVLLSDSRWGMYIVNATNVVTVPADVEPDLESVCSDVAAGRLDEGDLMGVLDELGIIPGDADLDGRVQFADFLIVTRNFGQSDVGFGGGDFDCSGVVQFTDFLELSLNFGSTSQAAAVSVPEPNTLLPTLVGLLLCGTLRDRISSLGRRPER